MSRILIETPLGTLALDSEGRMSLIDGNGETLVTDGNRMVAAIWAVTTAAVTLVLNMTSGAHTPTARRGYPGMWN